jgi:D-sedoheptulose 7-phosphate isomerase
MPTRIEDYLEASTEVLKRMAADPVLKQRIASIAEAWTHAICNGGKVLFAGNGGSAGDAQHLAGELVSRFNYDRPGMAGIALTTDTSVLTAIGNDYGFEHSFSRQVQALARPGDVLVCISTSGNSPSVLRALAQARAMDVRTIGFTGRDGGAMAALCDIEARVPAEATPLIQQGHLVIGHLACALTEEAVHPRS